MPFPVPFNGPPTGTLANLAMSHANAELLEITGMHSSAEKHFSTVDVQVQRPFARPSERISAAILRSLLRLMRDAPDDLVALLQTGSRCTPTQWSGALAADVDAVLETAFAVDSVDPGLQALLAARLLGKAGLVARLHEDDSLSARAHEVGEL